MILAESETYRTLKYEIWKDSANDVYYFFIKNFLGTLIFESQPESFITVARVYAKRYIDDVLASMGR